MFAASGSTCLSIETTCLCRSMHADRHYLVHRRHHGGGGQQRQVVDGWTELSVLVRSVVRSHSSVIHDCRADWRPGRLPLHITSQTRLPQEGQKTSQLVVGNRYGTTPDVWRASSERRSRPRTSWWPRWQSTWWIWSPTRRRFISTSADGRTESLCSSRRRATQRSGGGSVRPGWTRPRQKSIPWRTAWPAAWWTVPGRSVVGGAWLGRLRGHGVVQRISANARITAWISYLPQIHGLAVTSFRSPVCRVSRWCRPQDYASLDRDVTRHVIRPGLMTWPPFNGRFRWACSKTPELVWARSFGLAKNGAFCLYR